MRKKIELEDIIGIVKTDEITNSVELKKEVYNDAENQFKFDRDTVATNLKTPIVYDGERMNDKRFRFDEDMNIEEYKDNGVFIESYTFRHSQGNKWDYDREKILDKFNEMDSEIKRFEKENRTLKLLVHNWEQLDDEKDEQLEKMNDSLKRLVEENKQLQQELFESEVDYYTETFRDDYEDRIIDLKKEFKERFGRDFE